MDIKRFYRLDAVLCLIVAALAAWAVAQHPHGYFTFLRWVTCITAGYMAWRLYETGLAILAVSFGLIAILFNPLAPIHLSRQTWRPLDIACAAMFTFAAYLATRLKPLA